LGLNQGVTISYNTNISEFLEFSLTFLFSHNNGMFTNLQKLNTLILWHQNSIY